MDKFNIILTSSGFNDVNNYVSEEMRELYNEIAKNKKVLILANAAPEGSGNFIARENVMDNFKKAGASKVSILDADESNINTVLDYDIIYGLGGDPRYLIELNQFSDFKNTLVEFLKQGVYIGESAGTMILCDDLQWVYFLKKGTKKKYDIELETYEGLNLTKHKVFPHWNKLSDELKEKTLKYEKDNKVELTKLNDGEYILEYYC